MRIVILALVATISLGCQGKTVNDKPEPPTTDLAAVEPVDDGKDVKPEPANELKVAGAIKEVGVQSIHHRTTNGTVAPKYRKESTATWAVSEKDRTKLVAIMKTAKVNGVASLYDYALASANGDSKLLKEIEDAQPDKPRRKGGSWSELTINLSPSGSVKITTNGPDVEGAAKLWEMLEANANYTTHSLNPDGMEPDLPKPAPKP